MSFLDRLIRAPGANPAGAPSAADAALGETETVRRIVGRLESLPPERARFLAGFAYILARAANADLDIGPDETRAMEQALVKVGDLDEAHAVIVVEMAKLQSRAKFGTEDFLVTREFSSLATQDEKIAVVRACFTVGAANDEISSDEADTINEIARELDIDRPALNAIREPFVDEFALIRDIKREAKG
jgi:tellurite resistance protein